MTIIFYEQDIMLTWYDTWGMVAVFKRKRNGLVYMNIFITKVWYMIEMRQRQCFDDRGNAMSTAWRFTVNRG